MRRWLGLLLLAGACAPRAATSPSPPTAAPRAELSWAPAPLRLCSWNVRKLGHGSSTDYDLVAQVIDEGCDLAAIVEVMQKQGGHPGYDALLDALGRRATVGGAASWSARVSDSPRPRTRSGSAEYYAVFWRGDRLGPCADDVQLRYHRDHDGSDTGVGPDHFRREPAFACFRSRPKPPQIESFRGPDFVIASYHARWDDGDEAAIAQEVGHLGEVFASMAEAYPGERDLWLMGDLNLRPERLKLTSPSLDFTAAESGLGQGSTLNRRGERTDNLYDHLVVHDPSASIELLGPARVIDVRAVASTADAFFRQVSDHLPIVVHLDPSVADDD